jgi:hypothetical protein
MSMTTTDVRQGVVADALEAVHLLLGLPLFVVLVGVDPAWLQTLLRSKHRAQLASNNGHRRHPHADDYLERIFQLTYAETNGHAGPNAF